MQRIPEADLMDDPAQATAYGQADFSEAHDRFIVLFRERFGMESWGGPVLDLGCGTGDITVRFAKAFRDRDFRNSLCAAYRSEEVEQQILRTGLKALKIETVSDRHWIAWGRA